ncbi:hypothetical protein XENTR_v10016639 [Xenopus tropicalis]|nr:hypothetical protein XENTR_v10016639 [Xenopus tropicalis]
MIGCDKLDSTIATHQKDFTQQVNAELGENECKANYIDPSINEGRNLNQYGTKVGKQEELELVPIMQKENSIHDELIQLLEEDDENDLGKLGIVSGDISVSVQPDTFNYASEFHHKEESIPCYIEQFEKDVQDDIIVLGSLSQNQDLRCQKGHFEKETLHRRSNLTFKKTESQLLNAANAHREEILAKLGTLSDVNNESNGAARLCWKLRWLDRPQPIQILFKCLRGVKDKVPKGHYVLKASLLSRLGGHTLHWSKAKDQRWAETSLPVNHSGQYYDVEMTLNYSVHTLLPTERKIKSGMTLLLELCLLHGKDTYTDRVVGWGVFPLCNNNLQILEGKYRCPFLRGHYDSRIDRFSKIEALIMTDLDHWLCNLYFQIIKLPACLNEQNKPESFVQLPREFLSYASHNETKEGGDDEMKKASRKGGSIKQVGHSQGTNQDLFYTLAQGQPLASQTDPNVAKEFIPSTEENMETKHNALKGEHILKKSYRKTHQKCTGEDRTQQRTMRNVNHKMCKQIKKIKAGLPSNKIVPYAEQQSNTLPLEEDFDIKQKKRKHVSSGQDFQWAQKSETVSHKQAQSDSMCTSYQDKLEMHHFSVCQPLKGMRVYQRIVKRTSYIIWAVFSEMDICQWRSHDFWSIILLMCLMWFIRLYLHYGSQWLFLHVISIPVIKFRFYPHTVELTYQHFLMHTREEVAMVVVGPMALIVVMLLMILLRCCCQMLFDTFPTLLSKFIIALGLWTALNPLTIFIVDALLGRLAYSTENPIADAAKLYWIFYRATQSGVPGIFITLLIYIMLFIISFSILYLYFLRLHKESWILDVFQRITCDEEVFHLPYDLEMSNQELSHIVRKAEKWRGFSGERRKVTVYDYIWKDIPANKIFAPPDTQYQDDDITTHVLIYTIHLSGFREIYRQFLRLPNGAIVEMFGDINESNILPNEVSNAAEKHVNRMEAAEEEFNKLDLRERKKTTS